MKWNIVVYKKKIQLNPDVYGEEQKFWNTMWFCNFSNLEIM